ncbi:hypothetical protein ACISK3_16450 [Morganella morganii]|nr:hypothetical protein [Morganella morganii]
MTISISHNIAATNNAVLSSPEKSRSFFWVPSLITIENTDTHPQKTVLIPVDPFAGIKSKIPLSADIFNKSELSVRTISDNEKQISCSWTENIPTYLPEYEDTVTDKNGLCQTFNKDSKCDKYPEKGRMDYFLALTGKHPEPMKSDNDFKSLVSDEHALKISQIAHQGHCAAATVLIHSLPVIHPYIPVQGADPASIYIEQTDRNNYTITSRFTFHLKNQDTGNLVPDLQLSGERVTQLRINEEQQQEYDVIRLTISHKQPAETLLLPQLLLSE